MKTRKILLPIFIALALFIIAQFFIVRQVWLQKDEVFSLRYRSVSKEAIQEMAIIDPFNGFEKAYWVIDDVSRLFIDKNKMLFTEKDSIEYISKVRKNIAGILIEDQTLSGYLGKYFDKLGLEKKFKPLIFVNYIELIDIQNKIKIYKAPVSELKKQQSDRNVLVYTFYSEGDNYKISFDYYIDVTNKEKIILREIGIILIISFLSFGIISIIFIATMRNYLEEKRLSGLKTDFINNMTHELKTPLSTITVAGKTLKLDSILNDKDRIIETADMIGKQSIHLNQLINLILEISMWERTQFQIDKKTNDVEEVLRDISDSFKNGNGNDCICSEKYDLGGATADIDILYFTTMVNNLLNNAVKYSGTSPEVCLEAINTNGITIKVSDNGIGISRSNQKHIFDKFFRVAAGNIHKTKGLGLGLYYVRKIAEAHGGTVNVSSKQGKGSVFIINIPLKI